MDCKLTPAQEATLIRVAAAYDITLEQALEVVFDEVARWFPNGQAAAGLAPAVAAVQQHRTLETWQAAGLTVKQAMVMASLERGHSVTAACLAAGVSSSTYSRWLKTPSFAAEKDELFKRTGRYSRAR